MKYFFKIKCRAVQLVKHTYHDFINPQLAIYDNNIERPVCMLKRFKLDIPTSGPALAEILKRMSFGSFLRRIIKNTATGVVFTRPHESPSCEKGVESELCHQTPMAKSHLQAS